MKPLLAWMNCYGAWDPSLRRPIETIGYDQYLDAFVAAVKPFEGSIGGIVISGGMLDALGRTECATTKPELERRLTAAGLEGIGIETDEESLTSMSIARRFVQRATEQLDTVTPLLFVDAVRYESNLFTVQYFCDKLSSPINDVRKVIVPLPRLDDDPHSTREFQEKKLAMMKEKGIEAIERSEEESRKSNP